MTSDAGKRLERTVKRLVFGALAGSSAQNEPVGIAREQVERILVVRANVRLGNLLLLTPALHALHHAYPKASIDVLGYEAYLPLLAGSPGVGDLIGMSRHTLASPRRLTRLLKDLQAQHYDLAIDGGRGSSFLGALLTGMSWARWRVASEGSRYGRFFNVHVRPRRADLHKVELVLGVLAGMGIETRSPELRITLEREELRRARARCRAMGLPPTALAVGINVGARGEKQWSTARIGELVNGICEQPNASVVLLAGPEDRARLSEVCAALPRSSALVAPVLPIREFAALLAQLSVIVTGDTGPMHLAAAVGVPTVSILVSPVSRYFKPLGAHHRVVDVTSGPVVSAEIVAAVRELWIARGWIGSMS